MVGRRFYCCSSLLGGMSWKVIWMCVLAMVGRRAEEDYVAWIKDKFYKKVRDFSFVLFFFPIIS